MRISSTRSTRFHSALASICTSALLVSLAPAAARTGGEGEIALAALRALELEAGLAKTPNLYLVVDPVKSVLEIRARGTVLESVPLAALGLMDFQPMFGSVAEPQLLAPAIWTVALGPGDTDRETIAPTELRPFPKDEEEAQATGPDATQKPAAEKDPEADGKPTNYRVSLDNGWQLVDGNEVPGALISAPVISNDSRCWWFPDYAIKSEIGTLYMTGEVIFTLAGEE